MITSFDIPPLSTSSELTLENLQWEIRKLHASLGMIVKSMNDMLTDTHLHIDFRIEEQSKKIYKVLTEYKYIDITEEEFMNLIRDDTK